jgi:hypothetical protein
LITPKTAKKKLEERSSRIYINLIGWVDKEKADFIFVIFSNGFRHQYDCTISYRYQVRQKQFKMEQLQFKT